jgi:multisubunit Na+/H+ antiporter MnhB subunit
VSPLGRLIGILVCLYYIIFRWDQVRRRYGRLDLLYWAGAMVFGWGVVADLGLLIIYSV